MGIYVFKYDFLKRLLAEDPSWLDFGRELIPAAIRMGNVQAFVFEGYWEDIGTITSFYKANLDLTAKIPKFNLFDAEAPVYTRARYLPPSKVEESGDSRFDYWRRLHHHWCDREQLDYWIEKPHRQTRSNRKRLSSWARTIIRVLKRCDRMSDWVSPRWELAKARSFARPSSIRTRASVRGALA